MATGAPRRRRKRNAEGPMTDEERALHNEMLRLKAEEARKKKEENMRNLLLKRKNEEEEFSRVNLLKIQNHWRGIMRHAKLLSLRQDVEILSQNHEREVDRKDAIINMLLQDLQESEEQYQIASRSHLTNVDDFIRLHEDRIAMLERDFQRELNILLTDFNKEREDLLKQHRGEVSELKDIMETMDLDFQQQKDDIKQDFQNNLELLKHNHEDELVAISNDLRKEVLDLYSHFRSAMDQYNLHTSEKQVKFRNLKKQDRDNADTREGLAVKIKFLQEQRDLIKAKMGTNDREFKDRNKALKEEKEAVSQHFHKLKARMTKFREDEARRLTDLTIGSADAIKKLEGKLEQAEKILVLAEICRKMETEEEKVLPFYRSTISDEEVGHAPVDAALTTLQSTATEIGVTEWKHLENFYKRYNKVLLDKLALDKEHHELQQENDNLKRLVQDYLNGVRVNEEVIERDNPLLMVNTTVKYANERPGAGRHIPVQELQQLVVTQHVA